MVIRQQKVNLIGALQLVHRHVTSSLCAAVFEEQRTVERARKWTLEAMVAFWIAVVARAPRSLRAALDECFGDGAALGFGSSRSSFFERSQTLSWRFFDEVFRRFVASVESEAPTSFEGALRAQLAGFSQVWVVDGSGLDRVAKRLKALRAVEEVVVPGSVLVCYDLWRGVPRVVQFHERLLHGEAGRLEALLEEIPSGTLLVADRGYSSIRLLRAIAARGLDAVVRLRRNYGVRTEVELGRHEQDGAQVLDSIVVLGSGENTLRIRLIEKTLPDGSLLRVATTVLDAERLPALVALELYRRRWTVERMFQDLKQVLNLQRFYAANTNAVGMQLFASAIVYAALRVTQAQIAQEHELAPEELSTAKLFPRAAAAHFRLVQAIRVFELIREANPGVELKEPDWVAAGLCSVPLEQLLVQRRRGERRKPGYSTARKRTVALSEHEKPRGPPPRRPRRK